jgi:hypothetical protein
MITNVCSVCAYMSKWERIMYVRQPCGLACDIVHMHVWVCVCMCITEGMYVSRVGCLTSTSHGHWHCAFVCMIVRMHVCIMVWVYVHHALDVWQPSVFACHHCVCVCVCVWQCLYACMTYFISCVCVCARAYLAMSVCMYDLVDRHWTSTFWFHTNRACMHQILNLPTAIALHVHVCIKSSTYRQP